MATWVFDRPAISFSAQVDTDGALETAALTNSPADFASPSAVSIAVEALAVDLNLGSGNDAYGVVCRIISGGVVLAGLNTSAYETIRTSQVATNYPLSFPLINFSYVLTTATKAQWDAATIEYLQLHLKTKGSDGDYITVAAGAGDITVTYTPASAFTLSAPTAVITGGTTATVGVTSNSATGTLYCYVSASSSKPSIADHKSGTGSLYSSNTASPIVGANTFDATGLTPASSCYAHWLQDDGAGDELQFTGNQFTTYKNVVFDFSTASSGDILLAIINHADSLITPAVVPTGFSLLAGASNNYIVVYEKEADGTESSTETFSYITSGGITGYGDIRSGATYDYANITSGKSSNTNNGPSIVLTPVNNDDFLLTGLGHSSISATISTFDSDLSLVSNTSNIFTKLRIGSGDGLTPSPSAHALTASSPWEIFAVYLPLKTVSTTLVNTLSGSVSIVGYIPTATATTTPNPTLVSTGYGTLLATGSIPTVTATTVPNPTTASPLLGAVSVAGLLPTVTATVGSDQIADPLLGTVSVTGYVPTVTTPNPATVLAVQGTVTITGYDPSVVSIDPITINPTSGAVLLTGLAPAVIASLNTIAITTGTVTPTVTETSLVAGNYTIILTLTNDTWIPL